jgi:hypothetical protein
MKLLRQTDDVRHRSRSGRPRAKIDKEDKVLIWLSNRNPLKNAVKFNTKMQKNYKVSTIGSTKKGRLRHAALFGRDPAKKHNDFSKKPKDPT